METYPKYMGFPIGECSCSWKPTQYTWVFQLESALALGVSVIYHQHHRLFSLSIPTHSLYLYCGTKINPKTLSLYPNSTHSRNPSRTCFLQSKMQDMFGSVHRSLVFHSPDGSGDKGSTVGTLFIKQVVVGHARKSTSCKRR